MTRVPAGVSVEQVRQVLDQPPYWLAGSYLPAYRSGRHTLEVLAYAVTAALKLSPYDDDGVDEVTAILRGLGYRDSCAPSPIVRDLTNPTQDDERSATWA